MLVFASFVTTPIICTFVPPLVLLARIYMTLNAEAFLSLLRLLNVFCSNRQLLNPVPRYMLFDPPC